MCEKTMMQKNTIEPASTAVDNLSELRTELSHIWGIDFKQIRKVISKLVQGEWYSISDIVQLTALSHKTIRNLLRRLEPWLEYENSRARIKIEFRERMSLEFRCSNLSSESIWELCSSKVKSDDILLSISDVVEKMPKPIKHLDHVSAKPNTCARRAFFLSEYYDLIESEILFLGDHDLTSIALAHFQPEIDITVVDIDERLLSYINTVATNKNFKIRTVFADFRVELPRSLLESFDLVFTDPPYSPTGIKLFLKRGLESLKRKQFSKVFLCYGFSELHPSLGFKVQSVFQELRIVTEAILPYFNRYTGAEAIGSSSALYICRPTRKTWSVINSAKMIPNIYTHGKNSIESKKKSIVSNSLSRDISGFVDKCGTNKNEMVFVGDNFTELPAEIQRFPKIPLSNYLNSMYSYQGKPPFSKAPYSGTAVVNLYPFYGAYFIRFLLVSEAKNIMFIIPGEALGNLDISNQNEPVVRLIESKYSLSKMLNDDNVIVVTAKKTDNSQCISAEKFILRYIADRRHAKLINSWRESLIAWFSRQNLKITKRQSKEVISKSSIGRLYHSSYLSELPIDMLRIFVKEVNSTIEELRITDEESMPK
jgi:predicted methyltransferase